MLSGYKRLRFGAFRHLKARDLGSRILISSLLPLFGFIAAISPDSTFAEAVSSEQAMQCWKDQELLSKPGDAKIAKGVSGAFVPPPLMKSNPVEKLARKWHGAIRRVRLPEGSPKLIALTFDLCEQPYEIAGYDGRIVDILRQENVRATFFAGGKWLLTHETPAQQLIADSHFEIGNHTWEHRNLRLLSGKSLQKEIQAPQAAYELLQAKSRKQVCYPGERTSNPALRPMKLFRFPFGACNQQSLSAVNEAGLIAVQWDVSSGDPSAGVSAAQMTNIVVKQAKPGSIILFHANGRGWHTRDALAGIIRALKERGFIFVTVNELINAEGAEPDIRPECFDERPGDTDRYDELARRLEAKFQEFQVRFEKQSAGAVSQTAQDIDISPAAETPENRTRNKLSPLGSERFSQAGATENLNEANTFALLRTLAPYPTGKQDQASQLTGHFENGIAKIDQRDLEGALGEFQSCRTLAEQFSNSEPANFRWLLELAFCQGGIGDVLTMKADFQGAQIAYDAARRIFARLVSLDPGNSQWQRQLAIAYAWLASSYWHGGQFDNARAALVNGREVMKYAVQRGSKNASWKEELAWFDSEIIAVGDGPDK